MLFPESWAETKLLLDDDTNTEEAYVARSFGGELANHVQSTSAIMRSPRERLRPAFGPPVERRVRLSKELSKIVARLTVEKDCVGGPVASPIPTTVIALEIKELYEGFPIRLDCESAHPLSPVLLRQSRV